MSIVDLFRLHFGTNTPATNDFSLIEYGSGRAPLTFPLTALPDPVLLPVAPPAPLL